MWQWWQYIITDNDNNADNHNKSDNGDDYDKDNGDDYYVEKRPNSVMKEKDYQGLEHCMPPKVQPFVLVRGRWKQAMLANGPLVKL